jgi:hypothetical protein
MFKRQPVAKVGLQIMIQLIRGFKDILPGEVEQWPEIERISRELFEDFGFKEIRIPIMERTELFKRSIGEDTDIVEKEMYTFPDRKGDMITNFICWAPCFAEKGRKRADIGNFIKSMLKFSELRHRWQMCSLF